ncbi:MAG: LamG domain-containing protein [Verrucomicrobia bacterium]|nr:LamG domain-containing protein [Verrucomicrobiota bacterium]
MKSSVASIVPANKHPVRLGMDQSGANKYVGELGRVSVFAKPLAEAEIAQLAELGRDQSIVAKPELLFTDADLMPQTFSNSVSWDFTAGFTIEAWAKPQKLGGGGARLVDKITPGQRDGFLFDTYPGNSLRFICGETELTLREAVPVNQWTHVAAVADSAANGCRLYVNGKLVADSTGAIVRDEAAYVSQMYHLQRFITACAGRGAYPIKFNGSLFTVPPGDTEKDPDYRRWGPGYWWQNTRLPYVSLCASGDFDLQRPLFRMYADELLPLCKYRTKLYLGHDGAFYPECIMFWGAVFSETYGWTPFEQRQDKLQESGWHKWEWVGGLELCWMMLDYYDHTLDRDFLRRTALPFSREILTFFEQHYPTNAQGKLVMHPSQALETWWRCTNAMPELAGCIAVTERLLALPAQLAPVPERELWQRLHAKLPPIPLREINGRKALAPAEFFAQKSNIGNPELYPVFPFRLFAFNRPNADWALTALEHRWDRGNSGWRQDDIFMAYLGLTDETRKAVVGRARSHDRGERFPAFWGPNYDWTPDQDHGGVLMKTFQAMLLQTDGSRIFLLPAWPKGWNVEFRLHAPQQTVVEGVYRAGTMLSLRVTPENRRADVTVVEK